MQENEWTQERVALVKRTICPKGIGTDEFLLFMEQCKRSGLDPLLKEAFCVARRKNVGTRDAPEWITCHEFQPAEAGMLTRAERFPDFAGVQASAVYSEDEIQVDTGKGEVVHRFNPARRKGSLVGAWARVARQGKLPVVVWLDFAGYVQQTPLWAKFPTTMIEKCARVGALRKAYPAAFGGLYIAGERPDDVEQEEPAPATQPALRKALPPATPRETLEVSPAREVEVLPVHEGAAAESPLVAREPGSDDGDEEPGPTPEEVAQEVEEKAASAATMEALHALKARAESLSSGTPERKRAAAALRAASKRLGGTT